MQRALYFICSATPTDSICCFVTSYEERAPRLTLGTESVTKRALTFCEPCHITRGALTKTITSRAGLLPKHVKTVTSRALTKTVTSGALILTKTAHVRGALTKTSHLRGALTKTAYLSSSRGALTKTVTSGAHSFSLSRL